MKSPPLSAVRRAAPAPARTNPDMTDRPTYIVYLRPEPRTDGIRSLKAFLKMALRRYRLRCVAISVAKTASQKMSRRADRSRSSADRQRRHRRRIVNGRMIIQVEWANVRLG